MHKISGGNKSTLGVMGGEEEVPKSVRWVGKMKHSTHIVRACVYEL